MADYTKVSDLFKMLQRFGIDPEARLALEDGEFGPLCSAEGKKITVRVGEAEDGDTENPKTYKNCVIIGWE